MDIWTFQLFVTVNRELEKPWKLMSHYNSLRLSGFSVSRMLKLVAGICSHSDHWWGPTLILGDEIWLTVCGPVHPRGVGWEWSQSSVKKLALCMGHGGIVILKQGKRQTHKVRRTLQSKISLFAAALRFFFIGSKSPKPGKTTTDQTILKYLWRPHNFGQTLNTIST